MPARAKLLAVCLLLTQLSCQASEPLALDLRAAGGAAAAGAAGSLGAAAGGGQDMGSGGGSAGSARDMGSGGAAAGGARAGAGQGGVPAELGTGGVTDDGGAAGQTHTPCAVACGETTPICDPTSGDCVQCVVDTDCDDERCALEQHVCVDCLSDRDCDDGQVCDLLAFECMKPCTSSATCRGEAPHCHPARLLCVECLSDADCDDEPCDPLLGHCDDASEESEPFDD